MILYANVIGTPVALSNECKLFLFETQSRYVTMLVKLFSDSQESICLCLPSAKITDVCQHTQPEYKLIFKDLKGQNPSSIFSILGAGEPKGFLSLPSTKLTHSVHCQCLSPCFSKNRTYTKNKTKQKGLILVQFQRQYIMQGRPVIRSRKPADHTASTHWMQTEKQSQGIKPQCGSPVMHFSSKGVPPKVPDILRQITC